MKNQRSKKRVYIIHGYGASPSSHWFPWLKKKLSEKGITADVLRMPNAKSPDLDRWLNHLSLDVDGLSRDTYFVAHSLGCVTLLNYLQQMNASPQIGGFILVSGFAKPLPSLPVLDAFTRQPLNGHKIMLSAKKRVVISAKDDPVVPFSFSKELARQIQADFHETESGGHFLESNGFITFPLVWALLIAMIHPPAAGHDLIK